MFGTNNLRIFCRVLLYCRFTGLEEQELFQEERSTDGGMVDGTPSSTLQEMQRTESRKTGISILHDVINLI